MTTLAAAFQTVHAAQPIKLSGRVATLRGLSVLVEDLPTPVGTLVKLGRHDATREAALGEVVGFTREHTIVMLLGQAAGLRAGDPAMAMQAAPTVPASEALLGRCVNALGGPIDDGRAIVGATPVPLNPEPISALRRAIIRDPLHTGVRAIDLMTTVGRGQRMGIFAGPGVGKSTLLGTIARRSDADVNVIALIGERGREVREFVEHSLGPAGVARSVVVVATGDESPVMRLRAARYACAVAEFFRDLGRNVLLMMDSVTRFAHAQRQVGLSVGEPPTTKGYTPSVFAQMALMLERAGAVDAGPGTRAGSITGLYTILVEGDDMTEPVSDAARGILDGHLVLSRKLAHRAHYPAIDVLDSISRVQDLVADKDHLAARRQVLRLMAMYKEVEDLVQIGAYAKGSSPETDVAIELQPQIVDLLRQSREDATDFAAARTRLLKLAQQAADMLAKVGRGRK